MATRRNTKLTGRSRTKPDPFARERALDALSQMRSKGFSMTRAAREASTTTTTIKKYVGSALNQSKGRRYQPTPADRFTRRVWILTPSGKQEIVVRNSRTASRVASHMAAVDKFLRTGSMAALGKFRGQSVRTRGEEFDFMVDPDELERLANAGEVSFERLYVLRA